MNILGHSAINTDLEISLCDRWLTECKVTFGKIGSDWSRALQARLSMHE